MSSDVRRAIHSAYTFVKSMEVNRSVATLTLDHMIGEQIQSLKQGEVRSEVDGSYEERGNRISRYDTITEIEKSLSDAISAIREAGSDQEKLRALGIYEVDAETEE